MWSPETLSVLAHADITESVVVLKSANMNWRDHWWAWVDVLIIWPSSSLTGLYTYGGGVGWLSLHYLGTLARLVSYIRVYTGCVCVASVLCYDSIADAFPFKSIHVYTGYSFVVVQFSGIPEPSEKPAEYYGGGQCNSVRLEHKSRAIIGVNLQIAVYTPPPLERKTWVLSFMMMGLLYHLCILGALAVFYTLHTSRAV